MEIKGTPTLQMLYPDRRDVTAAEVISWARDLFEDSAPRRRCAVCGTVTVAVCHGKPEATVRPGEYRADDPNHPCEVAGCGGEWVPMHEPDQHRPFGLSACAEYLEDLGVATFRR